jgi:Fe-S oxidoreductase
MEPLDAMRELRATLVKDGHTLPQLAPVINCLRKESNMVEQPAKKRGDWIKDLKVKDLTKEKAGTVFHAGCRYSFDGDLGQVARTSVEILNKAGVDFGVFGKNEMCCSGRAYDMGYRDDFHTRADANLKAWKRAGVHTVVTPCAECFHTFSRKYTAQAGSEIKVVHMVQIIDELIRDGKLQFTKRVDLKVTYHDPCHLGRQGEPYVPWSGKEKKIFGQAVCYEPPRNILKAIPGLQLLEMERIKEAAWCCGAGGGAREAYPEFSNSTAKERLEEAQSTGAEAIVSACSWCERNFIDATNGDGAKLKVFDIVELVGQAL